jgi:hypothetical protein
MRSKKHIKRVSGLPCMICSSPPPNDAHHLMRTGTRGMGQKSGDEWAVPLCRIHHAQVTGTGCEEAFWAAHGWDYEAIKRHATRLWDETGGKND